MCRHSAGLHDEIDIEFPSRIQVVLPPPPCSRFECVQTHIIVEQGSRDQHVTGLVSFRHEPSPQPHRDAWEHRAYSWEQLQSTSSLLQLIGLTTACRHSICRITLKGFPFAMVDRLEYLEAADNIVIHIHSASSIEPDRVDLMQRSSSIERRHAIDLTGRATECDGFQTPHLNPDAPEFVPGVPNLWTQPADINDLYAAWRIGAAERQVGEPAAQFQVWFLCPEGASVDVCTHVRSRYGRMLMTGENNLQVSGAIISFLGSLLAFTLSSPIHRIWNQTSRRTSFSRSSL